MKKTLLYIIGIIAIIIVVGLVASFFLAGVPALKNVRDLEERDRQPRSTYDTAKSYRFAEDGTTILSYPASSRIDLKINGSDQPLRTKAPFSFTLSWKIDPAIDVNDCKMEGPNLKEGYLFTDWPGVLKSNEGSLRFENVIPGEYTLEQYALGQYKSAPLYNGVASFYYHRLLNDDNLISLECYTSAGSEAKYVVIRID